MNIDSIVEPAYRGLSLRELADAPVSALHGIGADGEMALRRLFGVRTVGELGALKWVSWAGAIRVLAEVEDNPAAEQARETLLDEAVEMSFPASDPVAISHHTNHLTQAPDMVDAHDDHQRAGRMAEPAPTPAPRRGARKAAPPAAAVHGKPAH